MSQHRIARQCGFTSESRIASSQAGLSAWNRRSVALLLTFALAICGAAGQARAGDTPSILSMFKRKPAELSQQELLLRPEHGPWMILAATLSGDDAAARASMLANEIRRDMKLPSFILEKTFDHTKALGSVRQVVPELDGTSTEYRAQTRYANGTREKIFAVLVGEFTSTEDPRIQEALNRVRTAHPKSLEPNPSRRQEEVEADSSNWLVQKYRSVIWNRTEREENHAKGRMGAAFVTRNPLLPDDFFQAPKMDDFVVDLNKQVEHSLLDCPGRFTVRVASFYGYATLSNSKLGQQSATSDALDKAAARANKLTLALRKQGVEAYQFHDRFGSYVTIGSFEEIGSQNSAGVFQYNPAMVAIMNKYCGYRTVTAKDPATGAVSNRQSLNSLERIPFDAEGKAMAVPRQSTNKLYSSSLLGGR